MIRRYILFTVLIITLACRAFAQDKPSKDPNQLFYQANTYYEQKDYVKALEKYDALLGMGFANPNLYYNIGNSFFKLGKIGYAILFYEKAKVLIPQDSDLKSNLAYARSLVPEPAGQPTVKNYIARVFKRPFKGFNLNAIFISAAILYIMVILITVIFTLDPVIRQKFLLAFPVLFIVFFLNLGAFVIRYYDEVILKHGIVIKKEAECKYEPIDASTTYYTLPEGSDVVIVKTRNDWRQIRRPDGKIAWVKKDAVGEI